MCGKFDKFLAHGQVHIGQMTMTVHNCRPIPQNFEWRKSIKRLQRYGFRKFGSRPAGRPPARTVTTIPLQPEGLRGKNTLKPVQNDQDFTFLNAFCCKKIFVLQVKFYLLPLPASDVTVDPWWVSDAMLGYHGDRGDWQRCIHLEIRMNHYSAVPL